MGTGKWCGTGVMHIVKQFQQLCSVTMEVYTKVCKIVQNVHSPIPLMLTASGQLEDGVLGTGWPASGI